MPVKKTDRVCRPCCEAMGLRPAQGRYGQLHGYKYRSQTDGECTVCFEVIRSGEKSQAVFDKSRQLSQRQWLEVDPSSKNS